MQQVTLEDIDQVAEGLPHEFKRKILSVKLVNTINYESLMAYLKDCKQNNLSTSYLRIVINVIYYLNNFAKKEFKDITKEDMASFLDTFRKPEPMDPLHKWIGTYNNYLYYYRNSSSGYIIQICLQMKDQSSNVLPIYAH